MTSAVLPACVNFSAEAIAIGPFWTDLRKKGSNSRTARKMPDSHPFHTTALEDTTLVSLLRPSSKFPKVTPDLLADVGASQLIIDGKIGLKNDSLIQEFTKTGLKFEDGSTLDADLVIFATGLGDFRDGYKKILGEELGGRVKKIWGLDSSGEPRGAWREVGVENLWCMMGNLALCRYHSRHLALRECLSLYLYSSLMWC